MLEALEVDQHSRVGYLVPRSLEFLLVGVALYQVEELNILEVLELRCVD